MRLALAQINTVVGDLDGNRERILDRLEEAQEAEADSSSSPSWPSPASARGSPAPAGLRSRRGALARRIARAARGIMALVGTPHFDRDLYNACAVCAAA